MLGVGTTTARCKIQLGQSLFDPEIPSAMLYSVNSHTPLLDEHHHPLL